MTTLTSREFNQDTARAKRAATEGPVYITDRGRPSHVLMTFEDYTRLAAQHPSIGDLLAGPAGVDEVQFRVPRLRHIGEPASFD